MRLTATLNSCVATMFLLQGCSNASDLEGVFFTEPGVTDAGTGSVAEGGFDGAIAPADASSEAGGGSQDAGSLGSDGSSGFDSGAPDASGTDAGGDAATLDASADGEVSTDPVVSLFQHCPFEGWEVSLPVGDYTRSDLEALGAVDKEVSSLSVAAGYEVLLYENDNFTGSAVRITSDVSCATDVGFNDRASSVRVRLLEELEPTGERGDPGITTCLPEFESVCKPDIVLDNPYAGGDASHFATLFPDIEEEMQDVTCTVCSMLYRTPEDVPLNRRHTTVNLNIKNIDPPAHAFGNTIEIDIDHVRGNTDPDSGYVELRGVMVHEAVHLYQHYGNGGTGEGMADCVRVQVGLYGPGRCGRGGSWRDAYTTSGCFYSWLTGPSSYLFQHHPNSDPELPAKINAALAGQGGEDAYDVVAGVLLESFGEDVDTLWTAYQADL